MPLSIKNFLKAEQVKKLQEALRENPLPQGRERVLIILLPNDGRTQIIPLLQKYATIV
jgi:hypothetical protein